MVSRKGMTLFEIIVVMTIIGIAAAMTFPNFNPPTELSYSSNASHNLLAIYAAQQNYNNEHGSFCYAANGPQSACSGISPHCGDSLAALNCNLSLSVQDDGSYNYACTNAAGFTCAATRTTGTITLTVTNNPIVQGTNPICTPAGAVGCPYNI